MSTIRVTRGDKFVRTAAINADKALDGAQIRFTVRRRIDSTAAVIALTVGSGIEITSNIPGAREYTVTVESEQNTDGIALKGEDMVFDIDIKYGDGDGWYTLDEGAYMIGPEISRDD